MDIEDNFNIKDLGDFNPSDEQMEQIKDLAEIYSNKSEDEIIFEIIKLNNKMENELNSEEYKSFIAKLQQIKPLLNEEQVEKLDKILEILKDK